MTPRLAAQYVFAFLDQRAHAVGDAEAARTALDRLTGPGTEELSAAVSGVPMVEIPDRLDQLALRWGASSLAALAFDLRSERHSAATTSYLRLVAEADATAPSVESYTAALFVVAVLDDIDRNRIPFSGMTAAAESLRFPGRDALMEAALPEDPELRADALEVLGEEWGSPVLTALAGAVRRGDAGASMRQFLLSCATSEANSALPPARFAMCGRRRYAN
ncbi:MAG: hypothetical protein QOK39_1743 [Acidimicrobiaceae bacterium]|jgi:hypothetical protein|nr:hypothetical protein [Acidimicrobiaceae bacterium]